MSASTAYRLRARVDAHAFRAAWDAARALAYERLTHVALSRVRDGVEQRTYDADGNLLTRRITHNDRLLMFLMTHCRRGYGERPADDLFGEAIGALDLAPAGAGVAPPVERGGFHEELTDDELIDAVVRQDIRYLDAFDASPPALQKRMADAYWAVYGAVRDEDEDGDRDDEEPGFDA